MSADTVVVWTINTRVPVPPDVLDARERHRAGTLLDPDARRRFTTAHAAVRAIVGRAVAVPPAEVRFTYGVHGKPHTPGVQLSVAHSGDLSLLALSVHRAVGVDVQAVPDEGQAARMAARWFPPAEAAGGADQFTIAWVRKEARVKAAGGRLVEGLPVRVDGPVADGYRLADLEVPGRRRAAVALAGVEAYDVVRRSWGG